MASQSSSRFVVIGGLLVALALAAMAYLLLDKVGEKSPALDPQGSSVISDPGTPSSPSETTTLPVYVPKVRPEPRPAVIAPTGTLTGRVVDANRLPITRGQVRILEGRESLFMVGGDQLVRLEIDPAEVAGDGRFHFAGLPVDSKVTVRVDGDDFIPTQAGAFTLLPGEVKDIGDIVTDKGNTILGSVFDPSGMPLAGARVALTYGAATVSFARGQKHSSENRVSLTNDEGHFEMKNTPLFPFTLSVSADGFANKMIQAGGVLDGEVPQLKFTIILEKARELHGRVVSKNDEKPLGDITLIAVNGGTTASQSVTKSDEAGRFLFKDLAAGPYRIEADGKGWSQRKLTVPANSLNKELIVQMTEEGLIRGQVTTPEGDPVSHYDLQALYGKTKSTVGNPTEHMLRIRDKQGLFELSNLEPGWYQLQAWSKGFALTRSDPVRVRAGSVIEGVTISLQHGATIRGRVIDDLDRPISGASISLHTNNLAAVGFLRDREWSAAWRLTTHTDKEGVFQLTDVSEKAYQLQVNHPEYPLFIVNDVITETGQLSDMQSIIVPRAGEIAGVAMDSSGQLLRHGTISLGGPESRRIQPDGEGRFRFARLLPGEYYLDARATAKLAPFDLAMEVQRGVALLPITVKAGQKVTATATAP
jgi:protocatechuate 3,4-dioxygenase beta subunit